MSSPGPRAGGPTSRRSFTPAQELDHLAAYEAAMKNSAGGAYLREQGIYSSQITEWRKLRDAGVLEGKKPGEKIGRLTAEQAEIARLRRKLDTAERRLARTEVVLTIMGKTQELLEDPFQELAGRTAAHEALMHAYRQITAAGWSTRDAAELVGVSGATATRKATVALPIPAPALVPANKLNQGERARILDTVNSPTFVDLPPIQIYAQLLDQGIYLGSISTIYGILTENKQIKERRRLARHPARAIPELAATGPGQVFSWDITKLPGPIKGTWFDCYVMIDIFSRYIVGAHVHASETGELAVEMMKEIFAIHGTPHVVHADRGTSMTSKTVAALLSDLEVTKSHSRPRVSNDNPFSEGWFKTLKFAPVFPERFENVGEARAFMGGFVEDYNHTHRHTGIGLNTPADVHYGLAAAKSIERSSTLADARAQTPERFSTRQDPKILTLHETVWINKPAQDDEAKNPTKLHA
ncbi:IS3 family transposase [Cryobacterium melibiosiphilum]|uniref:IS3 family transposase n=1 Tax=Cryobacterium melibiosiphilum TaxID=995039 RepID=A0A3A5MXM6_9MICO|nr:IS3 family transposase [Cryobacterium melibiosiphilum]RJT90776.1 IS3 family transposase [Cryobacterium melibiosiphilum]